MKEINENLEDRAKHLISQIKEKNTCDICGMIRPEFVECSEEEKTLTLSFPVMKWELNPVGTMHGGMVTALLDTTIGSLAACLSGKMTPTISLQTSYLRPGLEGMKLVVKAKVSKLGKSIIYGTAEAWEAGAPEKLIATASGTFKN